VSVGQQNFGCALFPTAGRDNRLAGVNFNFGFRTSIFLDVEIPITSMSQLPPTDLAASMATETRAFKSQDSRLLFKASDIHKMDLRQFIQQTSQWTLNRCVQWNVS
jgi:hypothetical protein